MTGKPQNSSTPDVAGEADSDLEGLASRFGLQSLRTVSDDMLDTELVSRLPVEWARSHCLLPVRVDGELCVLTAEPSEIQNQEDLALLLGEELRPVVARRDVIMRSIERCYFSKDDSAKEFLEELDAVSIESVSGTRARADDLLEIAEDAPTTQLMNLILLGAVKKRASDIHFEPFEDQLRVRYRVDGRLYEQAGPPKHMEQALVSRLKVMARMDIAERRLPQDGMARVRVGEREIDIRVSTVPVAEGERVVLRLLDKDSSLLPLTSLGMPGDVLETFNGLLNETYGLILVTGPTGSGKTTTLYAALREINSEELNIITIEDPIEYQISGIGQIQVKPKIGLTFAAGLRHVLRQDPDVILVGETRDIDTAETAARSSLTGHLVLSTLHTNDAPSAVIRMLDMGAEPYLLAASLRAVMAQRLVRRLCTKCREETTLKNEELAPLGELSDLLKGKTVWRAKGCSECMGGYRGRIGIYELMVLDSELREEVRRGNCSLAGLQDHSRENGMMGMLADGVAKVAEGTTGLAEVMNVLGKTGAR